jgi:hypothetical protein
MVRGQEGRKQGKACSLSRQGFEKLVKDLELNPSRRWVSSKRSKRLQDRQGTIVAREVFACLKQFLGLYGCKNLGAEEAQTITEFDPWTLGSLRD